ncbi:hypothetical protein Fmac_018105 [Flemingia macrophylla]|uniref:Uncharacterized protein n=1 Tax=Flemingia macrophylla TaxID=520843 RepID=A0ABD1M423_9FABA
MHGRWQVFKGKSNDSSQLLFSVKKSSMIQSGTKSKLVVFLANNKDENMCDFRVIITGNESSCTIYARESPTVVAEMQNNMGFNVRINPNVDSAFIVALLMIIMEDSKKLMSKTAKMAMQGVATAIQGGL